jgi:hypothetical protein
MRLLLKRGERFALKELYGVTILRHARTKAYVTPDLRDKGQFVLGPRQ